MANSSTAIRNKVVAIFDSTGACSPITVDAAFLVDLAIDMTAGSFTGTIVLEKWANVGAANAGAWVAVESYTTTITKVIRSASLTRYRLNCTAVTGGEARAVLEAGSRE